MPESAALVVLLRLGRRPWSRYAELVEESRSARAVLAGEVAGDGDQTTLLSADPEPLIAQATTDIERWEAAGIRLLTVLDPSYPDNLAAVYDRPPLIFVAGALAPRDSRAIAVIGSRDASHGGLDAAQAVAAHLTQKQFTVVSGLAAGIDTAAHRAALDARGRTIAVIGTGLTQSYPPQNAGLQREIAKHGAVVSQFWPESPPSRQSFPLRNATMSGLSLATVVVEASTTSGARIQARRALAHGRPVFLHRQVMAEQWARELARKPGTHVVEDPEEITTAVEHLTGSDALTG